MVSMPDQPPVRLVDSRRSAFVSFAPPEPTPPGSRRRTPAQAPTAVGPGRALIAEPNRDAADVGAGVTYPIQPGKVQPPALRDETLARTRLLDWLDVKIHNRVVFVIADAGYGKTTLLADFSRRTRLRTLWYRMDEEDRNWVTFLSYLVAAGREHEPDFAPRTHAMLQDTGPGGATRDEAVAMFLRELPAIAPSPTVLILDDYHVAEDSSEIVAITRQLITKAPERLTLIVSSRREPALPVARLRAVGELAVLRSPELRFIPSETDAFFRAGYGTPLEADVLAEIGRAHV